MTGRPAVPPAGELAHWTHRMLQALDGYWLWCDGWQGPRDRYPRSESTAEDWWHRFEKYRARVELLIAAREARDA